MCKVGIYSPLISLNSNLNYKEVKNNIVELRHLSLEKKKSYICGVAISPRQSYASCLQIMTIFTKILTNKFLI